MGRLILAGPLVPGSRVPLTAKEGHYLTRVLRLGPGAIFIGLDPEGGAFTIRLESAAAGTVLARLVEDSREPSRPVHLFLPLLKGDKLDWTVQKSVELGAASLTLYAARRAVPLPDNLEKKLARLEKIARQAAQQCRRQLVPPVRGLFTLAEAAAVGPGLFAWEEETKRGLGEALADREGEVHLLTGPEGGLAGEEAALLTESGWTGVTLGRRILRAETAAIALLTCVLYARGEMG